MTHNGLSRRSFLKSGSLALGAAWAGYPVSGHAASPGKRIATFQCDVTPPLGTPIYSGYAPLAEIETPLFAKGVILEENSRRYVLCAVDYCEISNATNLLFRQRIADAVGAGIDCVAVHTVHQHTAPMADAAGNNLLMALPNPPPCPDNATFTQAAERVGAAAAKAVNTLTPFNQVGTGQGKVERVASNRRVPLGDGTVIFRASSCTDPKLIEAPEGVIDPFVKTITFAQDGKPLARLHYYATHPQSFYGDPRACYDFTGMAREELQKREGVFQVYFTGCAGDIAAGKYNDRTPAARDGLYQRLLAGMEASVAATAYTPAGELRWKPLPTPLTPRDDKGYTEADCRAQMADEKAAASVRHTGAWVLAWKQRPDKHVFLCALHIGEVSILHLPGEPVIAYQLHAQQAAPGRFVAVAGYGDCCTGYICTKNMFAEGGYEPTATRVVPETEDTLRAAINEMLAPGNLA